MKKSIIIIILVLVTCLNSFNVLALSNDNIALIASYPIKINGQLINNSNSQYPVLVYKDITYLPLTWNYAQALGLSINWSNENGLIINKKAIPENKLIQDLNGNNILNSKRKISMPNFDITIDGKKIDNTKEQYPFFVYNNITYIPLTYDFAFNYLGILLYWDNKTGIEINMAKTSKVATNEDEEWRYFGGSFDEKKGVFKERKDGSLKIKLSDDASGQISVLGDWVYYVSEPDGNSSIVKIKKDGTNKKVLINNEPIYQMKVLGNEIYYNVRTNYNLFKIDSTGNKKIKITNDSVYYISEIKDGWIFYARYSGSTDIYKIKIDGTGRINITNPQNTVPINEKTEQQRFQDLINNSSDLKTPYNDESEKMILITKNDLPYEIRDFKSEGVSIYINDYLVKEDGVLINIGYQSNSIDNTLFLHSWANEISDGNYVYKVVDGDIWKDAIFGEGKASGYIFFEPLKTVSNEIIFNGYLQVNYKEKHFNIRLKIDEIVKRNLNLKSKVELSRFLKKNFSQLETSIGITNFTFDIYENDSILTPYDYWIQVNYNSEFFYYVKYSKELSARQRQQVKKELKDFQERLAIAVMEVMPTKKFYGGYYDSWYKYPNLKVGLETRHYYSWINFSGDLSSSYEETKPYKFKWCDSIDDEF